MTTLSSDTSPDTERLQIERLVNTYGLAARCARLRFGPRQHLAASRTAAHPDPCREE